MSAWMYVGENVRVCRALLSWSSGCRLMGLFGMPPLPDAEWWSGESVPFVSVPSVEVKGRLLSWYCSKIKWLKWDGGGTMSRQSRSLSFPWRHKLVSEWQENWSLARLNGIDTGSPELTAIFSSRGKSLRYNSGLKALRLLSMTFNKSQVKDELRERWTEDLYELFAAYTKSALLLHTNSFLSLSNFDL